MKLCFVFILSQTAGPRKQAMSAPTKAEREVCWSARDQFWKCLDDNSDDAAKCKKQRSEFEGNCSNTWVY